MNETEATVLIQYVAGLDPRIRTDLSPETSAIRRRAWTDILSDVPADFAMECVKRVYRKAMPEFKPLAPADIRAAWRKFRDRTEEEQEAARRRAEATQQTDGSMPDWYRPAAAAAREAATEFRETTEIKPGSREWAGAMERVTSDAVDAVRAQYPPTSVLVDDRRDRRERSCGNDRCRCEHTQCRRGFYDLPERAGYEGGARRCRTCAGYLRSDDDR